MTKRILLIRPDKIGDLILTLPMATVIKQSLPNAHISLLVREYTAPLVGLAPDVDETVIYDTDLPLFDTVSFLRATNSDIVFFFGSKFKLTLAAFLAQIPIRVGRAAWLHSFLFNRRIYEHRKTAESNEAEYNVRMLNEIGIATNWTPLPNLDQTLISKVTLPFSEYIVLHLTTGGSAPHWNDKNFIELGSWLNRIFKIPIVLTGLPQDHEYLFSIGARMKHSNCNVHIHTKSSLLELASVLKDAKLVVSGSTGPGHIAAALGVPTIGLFPGVVPLSKERWGFRGKQTMNLSTLTWPKAACPHCKDCICINEISMAQVIKGIKDLNIY